MSESRSSESRSGYSSSYSSESRSSGESRWGYTPSYSYESRNSNESRMSFAQSYSSKKSNNNVNKSSEKTVIDIKNKEQYNVLEEIDELIEKYNNDDLKEKSQNEKINSLRSDRRHKLEELKALRNSLEKALKNDALDEAIKSITRKMK